MLDIVFKKIKELLRDKQTSLSFCFSPPCGYFCWEISCPRRIMPTRWSAI